MLESLVENEACGLPPYYEYTPAVDDAIKYLDHVRASDRTSLYSPAVS